MNAIELRNKTVDELKVELLALFKEQLNLRIQKGSGQPVLLHRMKTVRLDIARIKTILNEKGFKA